MITLFIIVLLGVLTTALTVVFFLLDLDVLAEVCCYLTLIEIIIFLVAVVVFLL